MIFPPLENGLDYMESAVEHLGDSPTSRDLKYGVLHLAAAIEVLLKMRLEKEHWSLVFEDIKNASLTKYKSGDFKSVSSGEALERLQNIASVEISDSAKRRVKAIVEKRNKLQHYGINDSAQGIQAVTAGALDFLITFIDEELRDVNATGDDPIEETLNGIREKITQIEVFVDTRMKSLLQALSEVTFFVSCPKCLQDSLLLDDVCQCLFCLYQGSAEEIANEYVSEVLGLSSYIIYKDGGEWPIRQCPSCSRQTLVEDVSVVTACDGDNTYVVTPTFFWICFAEGEGWGFGEIDSCSRCGEPKISKGDDGFGMCSNCINYISF